jgi:hypothetical protein
MTLLAKVEAYDRMRDPGRTPPGDENVRTPKAREVERTCFPVAGVVFLGAIFAVADIAKDHLVAVDLSIGGVKVIGLPVTLVRRFDPKPPENSQGKSRECNHENPLPTPKKKQRCQHGDNVQEGD